MINSRNFYRYLIINNIKICVNLLNLCHLRANGVVGEPAEPSPASQQPAGG